MTNQEKIDVPTTVIDEMIKYIEETDQQIECEWGSSRTLQEVKDDEDMPDIYYKVISLKKDIKDTHKTKQLNILIENMKEAEYNYLEYMRKCKDNEFDLAIDAPPYLRITKRN